MTIVPPADHEAGWEYLYFASELSRGLAAHQTEFSHYQSRSASLTGDVPNDPATHVQELADEVTTTVRAVPVLLSQERLLTAFGPPGKPGNEAVIRHVASGLVEIYAEMMNWGQRVRGTSVPPGWEPVYQALSDYVALPLRQFQEFSAAVSSSVHEAVGELRAGREPGRDITLALNVSVDPGVVASYENALAGLTGRSKKPGIEGDEGAGRSGRPARKWFRRHA
jgi:hypothetical protein